MHEGQGQPKNPPPLYEDLIAALSPASGQLSDPADSEAEDAGRRTIARLELSLEALRVERETLIRLRDEGRINDEVLRRIERELDLSESRIAGDEDA